MAAIRTKKKRSAFRTSDEVKARADKLAGKKLRRKKKTVEIEYCQGCGAADINFVVTSNGLCPHCERDPSIVAEVKAESEAQAVRDAECEKTYTECWGNWG